MCNLITGYELLWRRSDREINPDSRLRSGKDHSKGWPASSYIKIQYAQKREISGWKTAKLSFRRARNATNRTQEVRYAFVRTLYPQYAKSQ
jgi:hypothetical protein